jgi:hypothetical protein
MRFGAVLARRPLACIAGVVLVVKLASLAVDSTPLYFVGDSATFIGAARHGWVPGDRSYVYPLAIRALAVWPGSLSTLLLAQTLAGTATAWLLAMALIRYLFVRPPLAMAVALALALAPSQLLHERMVLTESFALLAFAIFLMTGLAYLRRPRRAMLATTCMAGIMLVSLRTVYVPVTLAAAVVLPLLALPRLGGSSERAKTVRSHLIVAVLVTLACHLGFRHWIGLMANGPPAYIHEDGFFAISAWSPVIVPADADDPRAARVLQRAVERRGTEPYGVYYREALRWEPGWLVGDMKNAYPDRHSANLAAKRIASHALVRDPVGIAMLPVKLFGDYLSVLASGARGVLLVEQGSNRSLPAELITELRDTFGVDATATPSTMTPVKKYHLAGRSTLVLSLFAPLLCSIAPLLCRREARPFALWVCGAVSILGAGTFLFSLSPAFRYLHPFDFGAALVLAIVADTVSRARRPRRNEGPEVPLTQARAQSPTARRPPNIPSPY